MPGKGSSTGHAFHLLQGDPKPQPLWNTGTAIVTNHRQHPCSENGVTFCQEFLVPQDGRPTCKHSAVGSTVRLAGLDSIGALAVEEGSRSMMRKHKWQRGGDRPERAFRAKRNTERKFSQPELLEADNSTCTSFTGWLHRPGILTLLALTDKHYRKSTCPKYVS